MNILIIANYKENSGGISVQVEQLHRHLNEDGIYAEIFSTKGSLIYRTNALFRLLLEGGKYDVFHVHACSFRGFWPAVCGVIVGRILKKRIILTFHGGDAASFFAKHIKFVRRFLNRTDCNVVLSGYLGKVFDDFGIPYNVIPNAIDVPGNIYHDREKLAPRYISTRSFTKIYNPECSIKAFELVKVRYPDASLIMLGDGPLRSDIEKYVELHKISNVLFAGRVSNREVYDYLQTSDIMISSPAIDNMPVSILEGLNAGLLVISSNVGGVPYIVEDGVSAMLFQSGDYKCMADCMCRAVESPAAAEMARTGHMLVPDYMWPAVKAKLIKVYQG